jgi:MFS family permease
MRLIRASLLGLPDFRRLTLTVFWNSLGTVGEQVVLGWLTLELTDSPLMVGVALGVRMAPLLVVGIPAGVLADRVDRHRLLNVTSVVTAGTTATLGALAVGGVVTVGHLLVFTFAGACVRGLHQAARQSHAHELLGAERLVDGLALLGLAMRLGGLLGSLAIGSLIARLGPGAAYLAVAGGHLAAVAALGLGPGQPGVVRVPAGSVWDQVAGFVGLVRRDRLLPALVALTAGSEILGFSHQALLPSLARDVLRVGAEGLGAMMAARSVGGMLGIVLVGRLGRAHGNGPLFLTGLSAFGGSIVALGLAPGFFSVLLLLVVVNAMGGMSDVLSQTLIQLSVPGELRGRAGGAWVVAVGTAPLGQLQIGAVASWLGVTAALTSSGLALVAVAAAGALLAPRLRMR